MKINKAKILVATLATIASVATVGSISGTVAWFQYNTRVTTSIVGTTADVTKNLVIRIHDDSLDDYKAAGSKATWETALTKEAIQAYLTAKEGLAAASATYDNSLGSGANFSPVSYGAAEKNAALPKTGDFVKGPKANPQAGQFTYDKWATADNGDYIVLPLEVKLIAGQADMTGADPKEAYLAEKIWVTDITLQAHAGAKADMSSALRVHFDSTNKQLYAKNVEETATGAQLDMSGDGKLDKASDFGYRFGDPDTTEQPSYYGIKDTKQTSYSLAETKDTAKNPLAIDDNGALTHSEGGAIELGTTDASTGILAVKATIWFEGWALLNPVGTGADNAVWNTKYTGQQFDVGFTFAADLKR